VNVSSLALGTEQPDSGPQGPAIVARLRERSGEIERQIAARLRQQVPHARADADPANRDLTTRATGALIDQALALIDRALREEPLAPPTLEPAVTVHVQDAARAGISLGIVLRRCIVAHQELCELVDQEIERGGLSLASAPARHARGALEALLERLTALAEQQYIQERERLTRAPLRRRMATVRQLLAGERVHVEPGSLDYDLHASWHLGLVATEFAPGTLEVLVRDSDLTMLLVPGRGRSAWAWLGTYEPESLRVSAGVLATVCATNASMAAGEPRKGIEGWRQTHLEAREALPLALRARARVVRYGDNPLLAAAVQNETLSHWLLGLLAPLRAEGDLGARACESVRAYIRSECSRSSAAVASGVSRHTVQAHVNMVEQLLGRPLNTCLAEVDAALALMELDRRAGHPKSTV
jgi:hypothetical protein